MSEPRINEKTASWLALSFYDKDDAPVVPVSLSYRIDCLTTGAEIVADTVIAAAASVEVKFSSTVNSLQNQTNPYERREVTVTATHGADDYATLKFQYLITNLGAVS